MSAAPPPVSAALDRLTEWLTRKAFPIWWDKGADRALGGFHEKLAMDGAPVVLPKRARVQPRQIYAFSEAARHGWFPEALAAMRHGLEFYLPNYRRSDGLFRTLVSPEGLAIDDRADFYDQAFALFGLNAAFRVLGADPYLRQARTLIEVWSAVRKHPEIGFEEDVPRKLPLCANPHMHLFEACLAWEESDPEGPWHKTADEIAWLALTRLIDGETGALREFFDGAWKPMEDERGKIVEPGHQFEWAWLLLRWGWHRKEQQAVQAGMRLIEIGEAHGVDSARGVAFNALSDDFSARDRKARLWPQTERLKAHALAAALTGDTEHWHRATDAAFGLMRYFETPVEGLWRDVMDEEGGFIEEPAPASSFYHIVCAVAELQRVVKA